MRQNYGKDTPMFHFYQEYWGFIQKYAIAENTEDYWEELLAESSRLQAKYRGRYFTDVILAFVNEKERETRKKEGR